MKPSFTRLTALAGLALFGTGCSTGDATLRLVATDTSAAQRGLAAEPLEEFEAIVLNVRTVRVRIDAEDGASGWHDLRTCATEPRNGTDPTGSAGSDTCELDLLGLLRGETIELAWGDVPAGKLTQLRFVLADVQGYALRADNPEAIPVVVPSGSQSGLKLVGGAIDLEPDEERLVQLRFDASASIREHQGGAVRVRPVIHIAGAETVGEEPGDENPEPESPLLE